MTLEKLITIKSAFADEGMIPRKYCCNGENIHPPVEFDNLPEETKTLALLLEDPDAISGIFTHWIAWNISPHRPIAENSAPGISGENGHGETGYTGPCPPNGTHRYILTIYALDAKLGLEAGADKRALLQAMDGHMLAYGEIMGKYSKDNQNQPR